MEYRDALLNPKIVFRRTGDGFGAFAEVPIFVDEILVRWEGTVLQKTEFELTSTEIKTHSIQIDETSYLVPFEISEADYFNHSCEPNIGLQGPRTLVAMRPIAKNEPLCYDYAMSDSTSYDEFVCQCGSPQCRKFIRATDWKLPELQKRYAAYFSPYLKKRLDII